MLIKNVVRIGSQLTIFYKGEHRRIRVESVYAWGVKAWDREAAGFRSFRFDRMSDRFFLHAEAGGMPDRDELCFGNVKER